MGNKENIPYKRGEEGRGAHHSALFLSHSLSHPSLSQVYWLNQQCLTTNDLKMPSSLLLKCKKTGINMYKERRQIAIKHNTTDYI